MSKLRVGINGFGRIGRTLFREWYDKNCHDFDIIAINNPGPRDVYSTLLKYDSCHGIFKPEVKFCNDFFHIGDKKLRAYDKTDPSEIPWSELDIDIVIDASGRFKDKAGLGQHLGGSVKKVVMCAPGKDLDGTFVVGINHEEYKPSKHHIISNASCTTNCLAPISYVLEKRWGIEKGFMTTVHAYTSDQNILDGTHSDVRRARAACMSMIPTTTGAAKALGQVIPSLKGKLDGYAIRVPTPDVSMVDLTVNLKKTVSIDEINGAMEEASESYLKGILGYTTAPLVSIDFQGRRESSIFDATLTKTIDNTIKLVSWYDNEVGFSNRVLELVDFIGEKL